MSRFLFFFFFLFKCVDCIFSGFGSGSQSAFQPVSNVIRRPGSSAAGAGRNGSVSPRPASWVCATALFLFCMIATLILIDLHLEKIVAFPYRFFLFKIYPACFRQPSSARYEVTNSKQLFFLFLILKNKQNNFQFLQQSST